MKTKLNITIEQHILADAKRYAINHNISLSQIIELHFKYITKAKSKKNILDLLKDLPKPKISEDKDLKDSYYRHEKRNMGFKVFVDANFLLDLSLQRAGFQLATIIVQEGIYGNIKLYTSPAILHMVPYYTSHEYKKQQSKQIILTSLNDLTIIDCDHATALIAMNSSFEEFDDALQYYTALKHEMDYFISGDKKLKSNSIPQLPVFTAGEFVKQLKDN